jgi:hypothetical protein
VIVAESDEAVVQVAENSTTNQINSAKSIDRISEKILALPRRLFGVLDDAQENWEIETEMVPCWHHCGWRAQAETRVSILPVDHADTIGST